MGKPVWITAAGSLGTIPENVFYRVPLSAVDNSGLTVYFKLIAGQLPSGMQLRQTGVIEGTPQPIINVQGVPTEVSRDITSQFVIRAYTEETVSGVTTTRITDQTFAITVTGQDIPQFVTPAGPLGQFIDGTLVSIPIEFSDSDPGDRVRINLLAGSLPPGLQLDPVTGQISGIIRPLVGPPGTAQAGYDLTEFSEYPFDFSTRSINTNFEFILEITDGKESNVRSFSMFVYARNTLTADNVDVSCDSTIISADVIAVRPPVLLTPPGSLGVVRADNFYAFQFEAIDFDRDAIEYSISTGTNTGFDESRFDVSGFSQGVFSLPPGLTINPETGWFYGYIPDQGAVDATYQFGISVYKKDDPTVVSHESLFSITIAGDLDTQVFWLTDPDLGTIPNGAISTLGVSAYNSGGRSLTYQLDSNSVNTLPPGLELRPDGNIVGRASFNTFALDGGYTTFNKNDTRYNETTFDLTYEFTVNAFAPVTEQASYQIASIVILNPGSGYSTQPTITISAPPDVADAITATAGLATIAYGQISAINISNPGRGYRVAPTISITGGGGTGAEAVAIMREVSLINAVSVYRTFTVKVNRVFNEPYQSLYIKAMPPEHDRTIIAQLLQNQDIIPESAVYRAGDPNFGVAKSVVYMHAYGLRTATLDEYFNSLAFNHYNKFITLGEVKTAQAIGPSGEILYEVVYSEVVDNLVNNAKQSVGRSVNLAYTAYNVSGQPVATVYPNSLDNMRNQVISAIGQRTPDLPLWMTSKQKSGQVLGFVPCWVIAYVKPNESAKIAYNIKNKFGGQLNQIDFTVDRYELDCSQTRFWEPSTGWALPAQLPSVIVNGQLVDPTADQWSASDNYDKYLIFPKRTILG